MKLSAAIATAAITLCLAVAAPAHASPLIKLMHGDIGQSRPQGCPNKWCACYLNKILAEAGLPVQISNRAKDFASYGKPAQPGEIGAIMVMKNHVGVVVGQCEDGKVQILSGNYSRKVLPGCYDVRKAIAWRKPLI